MEAVLSAMTEDEGEVSEQTEAECGERSELSAMATAAASPADTERRLGALGEGLVR